MDHSAEALQTDFRFEADFWKTGLKRPSRNLKVEDCGRKPRSSKDTVNVRLSSLFLGWFLKNRPETGNIR